MWVFVSDLFTRAMYLVRINLKFWRIPATKKLNIYSSSSRIMKQAYPSTVVVLNYLIEMMQTTGFVHLAYQLIDYWYTLTGTLQGRAPL